MSRDFRAFKIIEFSVRELLNKKFVEITLFFKHNAVLVARVASILSRRAVIEADAPGEVVSLGRVAFHVDGGALTFEGRPMPARLTNTEAGLLRVFARFRGRSLSAAEIVSELRGEGQVMETSTLRAHIAHLREKLGPAGDLIVTDRDAGYRLVR